MAEPTYNFPSVEETTNHPAYKGTVWKLEPHSSGHLPVGEGRGGPFNLYWEVHGNGPTKLIVRLLGPEQACRHLTPGSSSWASPAQSRRGRSRRTTSATSTGTRTRCSSSTTAASGGPTSRWGGTRRAAWRPTCSRWPTTSGGRGRGSSTSWASRWALDRVAMLRPKTEARAIRDTALAIFPPAFLRAPDGLRVPSPARSPMCAPADTPDGEYPRFGSNFQRFQAQELHKRRSPGAFTLAGFACQLLAAAGHSKSPAQLRSMADAVGRERILVLHGTADKMLVVRNGERLARLVEPGVVMLVDDMGHAPIFERSVWFNGFMDERLRAWSKL
ncbi:glycylpeptide N-tetradecanoyltransferase [Metarhizium acridum CQMa 102]|uniref:Glycylpeptide N-tetradecanoyltransferase n=1 Tax=Metarhizium acridum (strain CQMa 102) TaxID=655827 RepID=E9EFZ0_METAQ|nr:glycylpeptide N-tetradecanoyltransferase [Metarhizium acridum CQMa 102]EFY85170.1 glycylpeptide N-tetradecanoyltransferase [Metarhizium acridum CQMa 102]